MSRDWMLKTLTTLGLDEADAQLYTYLTVEGPQQAKRISEAMNLKKPELYRQLKRLQHKGMVETNNAKPTQYSAIPFDRLLDQLIRTQLKEAQWMELEKDALLNQWYDIVRKQ
jgi:sugar-specific transcriptional regulator TrmB